MTTTPNPTAAEHEKALATAQAAIAVRRPGGPDLFGDNASNLARCYLALKTQLAESERARAKALKLIESIDTVAMSPEHALQIERAIGALAENTAEETMDPGPDDFPGTDEGSHLMSQDKIEMSKPAPAQPPEPVEPSDDALFKIETAAVREVLRSGDHSHRAQNKAVRRALYRAGLAAEAAARESAEETKMPECPTGSPNCKCTDAAHQALIREMKDQPPEPVEPSDDALWRIACGPDDAPNSTIDARRALYRAGLAAEAAVRANEVERLEKYAGQALLRARVAQEQFNERVDTLVTMEAELERVRAELATAEANATRYYREAGELRAQARARRVPTREAIADALWNSASLTRGVPFSSPGDFLECADAVLRLFAEADAAELLVTSDNEPPVPLPPVLPKGTRVWINLGRGAKETAVLDAQSGPAKGGRWYSSYQMGDGCGYATLGAGDIDWSHYRARQRAAEPTPAVTCTWAAYAGKSKVGCDQATDHPSGICDLHRKLADSFGRDVFPEPAPEAKYIPTVGERAVLVASPDPDDAELVGQELDILVEDYLENGDPHPGWYWRARDEDGNDVNIHRDATWRPASTPEAAWNYSAPPDSEIGKVHELLDSEHAQAGLESVMRYTGRDPDGDPAWDQGQRILGWSVKAWRPASAAPAKVEPDGDWCQPGSVGQRDGEQAKQWSSPAEPSPQPAYRAHTGMGDPVDPRQPGGFLDALTDRVTELERRMTRRQKQAQETNDRLARLERDSHAPVDFTDIFDALTRRVDDVEIQARVMRRWVTGDYSATPGELAVDLLARIEREERERNR